MSFLSPAEHVAIFFPVAGSSTSNVLPEAESTHLPFIYSCLVLFKNSPTLSLTV
jgi:hypothetical protein